MKTLAFSIYLVLLIQCMCLQPDIMTHNMLQIIKVKEDYVHHIIFFNQETFHKLVSAFGQPLQRLHMQRDIQFYLNDCNTVHMKQCDTKEDVPVVLLFNRIFIRFNGGDTENQVDQIYDWILSRIMMSPVLISTKDELIENLNMTPQMFCYCLGNDQQMAYFYSLSKALIITNYCILENKTVYEEFGLKAGNVTFFKNGALEHRIEYEYPNRYDMWEMFLKINAINHVKKSNQLIQKRFSHQNKNIDTTIVICDFSYKCEQFWMEFHKWSRHLQMEHPQIDIAMAFFDQKQILLYNVYFSTVFNYTRFPALLNVKILSENGKAGWFRRYFQYPEQVSKFLEYFQDEDQILKFVNEIKEGKIPEAQLSGQIPSKNGFTGKNSQRLIQKLVAKNLNQTISNSQKHYILLLSTSGKDCKECEEFYKEYRKVASFLVEEDITFGYMDVLKNQVRIDNVRNIPQVLLYNKYFKNDPVVMAGRQNFDGIMRFLENNAIINYSGEL